MANINYWQIGIYKKIGSEYIEVSRLDDPAEKYGQQTSTIKRAIRHAHSYRGGGYGTFGGYDIILFELDTPFNTDIFACLPSPKFRDTNIKEGYLAGYGLYLRDEGKTCQTNEHGRTKHHYCQGVELETRVIRSFGISRSQ